MDLQPYTDDLTTYKSFKDKKKKVDVGIDEAGRGPVLGHMVYGALIANSIKEDFKDSKQLTQTTRNDLFSEIEKNYSFIYTAIHPQYISRNMLKKGKAKKNLNQISYETVINIIKEIEKSYEINCLYLDALGPIDKYKKELRKHFPTYKIVIENKADSKYKIVSGASIIAKVMRDKLIKEWDLKDKNHGSGYPADEITIKWLERNFCKINGFPSIVRTSWQTVNKYTKTMVKDTGSKKVSIFTQYQITKPNKKL